jgi:hypothetical protein
VKVLVNARSDMSTMSVGAPLLVIIGFHNIHPAIPSGAFAKPGFRLYEAAGEERR